MALDHALTALKLLPDFVPAALIAARIHSNRGEARKAMSLLRRIWRATGHPDVAALYAHAQPGASAVDRLRRLGEIIETPPPHRAAGMALARAAIDAYDWPLARKALAPFTAADATPGGVRSLMAEIEEGQNGDQGKAREWLARAMRAPRDPAWTADGLVSRRMGAGFPGHRAARRLRVEGAGDAGTGPHPARPAAAHCRPKPRCLLHRPKTPRKRPPVAALAQLVEHIIRNDGVRCSSHLSGTTLTFYRR